MTAQYKLAWSYCNGNSMTHDAKFNRIRIQGFKSFAEEQILDIGGLPPGVHFVSGINEDRNDPALGSNGAGKSTIWDSFLWCGYNRTVEEELRGPDIIPWYNNCPTRVGVLVGKDELVRTAAPNSLTLNGDESSDEQARDLFGVTYEIAKHAIILGQGQPLFMDLRPADKLRVLSDTLGLDRWEERSARAADKVASLGTMLTQAEAEESALKSGLSEVIALLNRAQQRSTEWEGERKTRMKGFDAELVELNRQLAPQRAALDEATLTYDGAATEQASCEREVAKLYDLVGNTQQTLSREEYKLSALKEKQSGLEEDMVTLQSAKTCPSCGQPIKPATIKKHMAEVERALEKVNSEIASFNLTKLQTALATARTKLADAQRHTRQFKERADRAQTTVSALGPEVGRLEARIRALQSNKGERTEEVNPYRDQISDLRKRKTKTEERLEEVGDEIVATRRRIERTKVWVKGYKDIRLDLITDILHDLELATNSLLPESGLHNWSVNYDIERETKKGTTQRGLHVFIQSPRNNKPVKWKCWSGGEGQRIRIVGAIALSEVLLSYAGVKCNLIVLDEPTQRLSLEGVRDMCEFLSNWAVANNKVCFYIDHNARESASFASVIGIRKCADGSTIIE